MTRVAVIGAGGRMTGFLATIGRLGTDARVVAVADPAHEHIRARLAADPDVPVDSDVRVVASVDEMLEDADRYDAVLVGTRCSLHTPMALKVAGTGLPLFLEKPVATSWEQLHALAGAYETRMDSVVVSFPLRLTPLFQRVLEIVRSGRLGAINQVQAVNNVPYGGVYFGHWYRDYAESGGLFVQKATHDFDYINVLLDAVPEAVAATTTQHVYGGTMPDIMCSACTLVETCPESPQNVAARGGELGGMMYGDHWCAYSASIRNEDAGSALLLYPNGVHASYSQNFLTRRSAARRGAVVTGYLATLSFDWWDEKITVVEHHGNAVEEIDVRTTDDHAGGDVELAKMFLDVVGGQRSRSSLAAGIASAATCLAARDSSESRTFETVPNLTVTTHGSD